MSLFLFGGILEYTAKQIMFDETGQVIKYKSGLKKGEEKYHNAALTQVVKGKFFPSATWELLRKVYIL